MMTKTKKPRQKRTKLIFDADMLLYIACERAEQVIKWDNDIYTLHADLSECKCLFDNHVAELVDLVCEHYNISGRYDIIMCLSDSEHNFRKLIYPEYKANRGEKRRPIVFNDMREWIMEKYKTLCIPWLEADDVVGITARPDVDIIISGDKDFKTIPCRFYDISRNQWHEANEEESNKYHLMQTLTGDSTDNYKGCPNIGDKRAERFLEEYGYTWQTVKKTYEMNGSDEKTALLNARLAFILRKGYYNKKKGIIKLWGPGMKPRQCETLSTTQVELSNEF